MQKKGVKSEMRLSKVLEKQKPLNVPRVLPDVIKLSYYMRDVGPYHLEGDLLFTHNFKPEKNKSLHK